MWHETATFSTKEFTSGLMRLLRMRFAVDAAWTRHSAYQLEPLGQNGDRHLATRALFIEHRENRATRSQFGHLE